MEQELKLLRQLQEFDLEIEGIQERAETVRASLDELTELHASLARALDHQKAKLEDTRSLMRQKDVELAENEERYKESRDKLNRVANTREYNALEREMESLRKQRAQLEEEQEQLREAVQDAEGDVAEKEQKTSELAEEMRQQQATIEAETAAATKRINALEKQRDGVKANFADKKTLLRRYEFIRDRTTGSVIVAARSGACCGCNMLLPPQLYNELQAGTKVIQCPNCKRILFHDEG